MHQLQIHDHRDLHLDDRGRLDVVRHLLMDLNCDMDLMQMVHLILQDAVLHLDEVHLFQLGVVLLDEQQNLDAELLVVVHLDEVRPLDAVVDEEQLHLLRTDYYLDEVGVELLHLLQMKMDCCLDEAHLVQLAHLVPLVLELQQLQLVLPALPLEML